MDSCYSRLLRGSSGNCSFVECINTTEVSRMNDNYIVIKNSFNIEVNSDCGITQRNLSGTFLIEFHNCSIFINGSSYQNVEIYKREKPLILSLAGLNIFEKHFEPTNDLKQLHISNRQQIENVAKEHKIQTYTSISMSTISIVLAVIMCMFWIRRKRFNIKIQQENPTIEITTTTISNPPTTEGSSTEIAKKPLSFESRRFDLGGGVVKHATLSPTSGDSAISNIINHAPTNLNRSSHISTICHSAPHSIASIVPAPNLSTQHQGGTSSTVTMYTKQAVGK